ncbi:MAG: O-antigen ligase family protein [Patescibacteria group bacterium]
MSKHSLKAIIFSGLFLIPFIPFLVSSSFFFPFITTKAFAFRVIVEIVFGAWLILALLDKEYRPRKSPILFALLSFLVVIGIANLFGEAPVKSFWSNYERMEGYVALLHLGALFLVMGSVFRSIDWKRWWNTSLVASFLLVIYCSFQLAGVLTINQGGVRVDGTLGNASYLAVYLLFHIFVALIFFFRSGKNSGLKWLYGLLALLQLFILYHTATRGAILGLIGGLIIIAVLNLGSKADAKFRKVSVVGLIALVVLIGSFLLVKNSSFVRNSPVLERFASISTEELKSGGRSFVWPMALKGIKEKPLLGWGQDNFNYIFNKYYDPNMFRLEPWFDRAHNIFLDWAVAGGLLGLASYLSLYAVLLYIIWRKDQILSWTEKSMLTGLIAAYFFHNIFVFDNLVSYILFFALLAQIHSESKEQGSGLENSKRSDLEKPSIAIALPITAVLTVLVIYFVNISSLRTNLNLLKALVASQGVGGGTGESITLFEKAHGGARLGRPEVVEQIEARAPTILASNLPIETRNEFFRFASRAIVAQAETLPTDARYQLIAGTFYLTTGSLDEALKYLERAQELSPGKQAIRLERGIALIEKGEKQQALQVFKEAFLLAPENAEAGIFYLIGAIYAGDRKTEQELLFILSKDQISLDQRVLSAYVQNKRTAEAINMLYYIGQANPNYKAQADEYIRQLQKY